MAYFKNDGNVWLVKRHYYDDGEHFYEYDVCKDYDTAKARYESVLDELNQGDERYKGFKEHPENFEITDDITDVYCITDLSWLFWVEVTITKEDILELNNENNQ